LKRRGGVPSEAAAFIMKEYEVEKLKKYMIAY
jgi:hypothetical protein